MGAQCLVISNRPEDRQLGDLIASVNGFGRKDSVDPTEIRAFLAENPQTIILWDGDERLTAESIALLLAPIVPPSHVFVITDRSLQTYPWLFKTIAFSNHFHRRFEGPAPYLYARLALAALTPTPLGLPRFFPGATKSSTITLTQSGQKLAAVEAMQSHLVGVPIAQRLAALAAQVTDELIMNAIYDAPIHPDGTHYRRGVARDAAFDLALREQVTIDVASDDKMIGISVADQFGSLKRDVLMSFLSKDYASEEYQVRRSDPGAGLGLSGAIQAGLSLVFVSRPGQRTEVTLFVPKVENFRTFREGFRFLSVFAS